MATFTLDAEIGAFARVSQTPLEVLVSPTDGMARVSQALLEVLVSPQDQMARVSQSAIEVLLKLPIVGSKNADAIVKAHMAGSQTINAVIKATVTHGTRDVTYAYSGVSKVIYGGHTKTVVETIIPGCDLTMPVATGTPVKAVWDVWQSHFQWAVDKKEIARLRRDSLTGLAMWMEDPQRDGTDAGNNVTGHEWHFADSYQEAAHSGRYVLTMTPAKGNATLYSDSIYFSLQSPGVGPGMIIDAALVILRLKHFHIAARLKKFTAGTRVMAFEMDAVIRLPQSTSVGLDATLFLWGLGAFIAKAVVFRPATSSFAVNAQLVIHPAGVFTLGAEKRVHVAGSFTVGAVVRSRAIGGWGTSAAILRTGTSFLTTSAIIALTGSGSFGIDAFLQVFSFRIDARIFVPSTGAFEVDATVLALAATSLTVDAVLGRADTGFTSVDAVILRSAFGIPGAFE